MSEIIYLGIFQAIYIILFELDDLYTPFPALTENLNNVVFVWLLDLFAHVILLYIFIFLAHAF